MTDLWQPHYELRDHEIVDYQYWELPGTGIQFRGPAVDFDDPTPYFSCAGAAQTFGCFVARPLSGSARRPARYAGGEPRSRIGDTRRLLRRTICCDVINGGRFLVLQVMAARQCSNSRLQSLGTDLVRDRRHGDEIPAHMAWQRILDEDRPNLERYVAESQANWIDQYEQLLRRDPRAGHLLLLLGEGEGYRSTDGRGECQRIARAVSTADQGGEYRHRRSALRRLRSSARAPVTTGIT